MERGSNYRLMKLRDILFTETDEDHELSIEDMIEMLRLAGVEGTLDKRTVRRDLETLDASDFEVMTHTRRYGKHFYSHQSRLFETYQLRLIVDAILSARFITTNEKEKLIDKMKQQTSKHIAKTFPEPVLFHQSANMDYERVKLNIDHVHRAISEQKVLTYQYGKYDVNKQFQFNRDGDIYDVEPYALIWEKDYYYLIGRYQPTGQIRHYRLDRIRNISITGERFQKGDFNLQEYVDQTFLMFAGDEIRIKIRFDNSLVNVMLDHFGHEADITKDGDDYFILSTKAKLSDGLINWILTWGEKAKVLAPDHLIGEIEQKIARMQAVYND
ncbi:helix-turn-helix transcriptional regulator [Lentibacillus saliphilus]|uniref:helix-turn-helix transcriptional regulator n=1 Tax=Lentibacillus saliphilus TaxID=2737028 RepID=UPI001C301629|nr:WYL domain-containing protein [Lentibacillus saliphilus]